MPANLIPLVTNSGRIFTANKVTPESDGLVGIIDITERNKNYIPSETTFNASGDGLLVADSRNQVTLLQIANNRFNVVSANLREIPYTVLFTGKQTPQDQVMVILKEQKLIQIYALNGKLLESIKSNMHHQLEIKSAAVCPRAGLLLTLSNDACVLWSTNQSSTVRRERSLFAQQGCYFNDAKFSPDMRQIGTLFRDGNIILWDLDGISGLPNRQEEGQVYKFRFPSAGVKIFDFGQNMLVGAGPSFPYIVIKHTMQTGDVTQQEDDYKMYKLPNEARGIEQISFLTDKLLLGYLSEGIFYLVDLGQQGQANKLKITLEIRIPGALIKRFSVDHPMNALALAASNGNVFLYNLPAAIKNEQNLARKRQQMGMEAELVHTYLVAVDPTSDSIQMQHRTMIYSEYMQQSESNNSIAGGEANNKSSMQAYQNPFLTAGQQATEGATTGVILSQREGPTQQIQSPLLNTLERNAIFCQTGDIAGQSTQMRPLILEENQNMHHFNIQSVQKIDQPAHHLQSEQNHHQIPMPMTLQSNDGFTPNSQRHHNFSHSGLKQPVNIQQAQQATYGSLSIDMNRQSPPQTQKLNMHNITQSTVLGPYLHQQPKTSKTLIQHSTSGAQPIVQLTVPVDRSQHPGPLSTTNRTMTQDYLIQGMPTALLNQSKPLANAAPELSQAGSNQPPKFDHSIDLNYAPEFKVTENATSEQPGAAAQFNVKKLGRLLKQYGSFPEKYRTLTWKYLLKLPLNKEAFQGLLSRGVHPAFKDLHKRFPVASYRLYNKLVRIMSALGHWSPIFLDVSYMPQIVFPFLKVIPNDDLFVFELIMSIIVQWMQVWFEAYPAEPLSVCMAIEQIISSEDPRLAQHLRDLSFHPQQYGWPFLQNFFTEALNKDDWLKLMDHLFLRSNEPELLLYFLGAYLVCSKSQLMQIRCVEDLSVFINTPTSIPFKKIMNMAETLHSRLKTQVISGNFGNNLPVSSPDGAGLSCYQSFTRYPDHFVSFQNRLREKIVNQEEEIQQKTEILVDLKGKANEIVQQEERMRLQQEAMARAEADRKNKMRTEMETLLQERIRLDELQRKARLEHVQAIENSIKTSLNHQERLREEEHKNVQEEVSSIQRQQKYEFESRMQDEMIANLEFKANQKLMEQLQQQQQEEHSRQTREKLDQLHQEVIYRQKESLSRWEEQRAETRRQNQTLTHQLKLQADQLKSQQEQSYIEEQFMQVKQAQEEMEQRLSAEQQARELERAAAEELMRQQEQNNRQLLQDRDLERREKEDQLRRMQDEAAELQRLKLQVVEDRERIAKVSEERKSEVEKAREMRAQTVSEDAQIAEERRRIQLEKDQILKSREQLTEQERCEVERRDFMKMIRTTAENASAIVKDGQRQIELERASREHNIHQLANSAGSGQGAPWVMSHPKYSQRSDPDANSQAVQDVITERERLVREQNESLREQLSLQYSQQQLQAQQENVGKVGNQESLHNQSTISQEIDAMALRYGGNNGGKLAYMTPSSTSDSHFTDESSDVESYHHSKLKQMTHVPQAPGATTAFPYEKQFIQTHLMPLNHQQLDNMPQTKSSVGEDISSSFVSSATETDGEHQPMKYGDVSDATSMLTSNESFTIQKQQQKQQELQYQHQQQMAVGGAHPPGKILMPQSIVPEQVAHEGAGFHQNSNIVRQHQALHASISESQSSVPTSSNYPSQNPTYDAI